MRVRILGRIWRLLFLPRRRIAHLCGGRGASQVQGYTEHPTTKRKRILVSSDLPEPVELEVIIHECLHAADWSKDEEWVEAAGADIARVLWRLGWRRTP